MGKTAKSVAAPWTMLDQGGYSGSSSSQGLDANKQIQSLLGGLEAWGLPIENLIFRDGTYQPEPLGAGESRGGRLQQAMLQQSLGLTRQFAPLFQDIQLEMMERDPLLKQSRELGLQQAGIISEGLRGLESGGLPEDVRRQVLEEARAIGASRGLLESPSSALFETSQLVKQRENLRAIRLGQADAFLSGGTRGLSPQGQIFGPMMPGMDAMVGSGLPGMLGEHGRHRMRKFETQQMIGEGIGSLFGLSLGAATGGFGGLGGMFG